MPEQPRLAWGRNCFDKQRAVCACELVRNRGLKRIAKLKCWYRGAFRWMKRFASMHKARCHAMCSRPRCRESWHDRRHATSKPAPRGAIVLERCFRRACILRAMHSTRLASASAQASSRCRGDRARLITSIVGGARATPTQTQFIRRATRRLRRRTANGIREILNSRTR